MMVDLHQNPNIADSKVDKQAPDICCMLITAIIHSNLVQTRMAISTI